LWHKGKVRSAAVARIVRIKHQGDVRPQYQTLPLLPLPRENLRPLPVYGKPFKTPDGRKIKQPPETHPVCRCSRDVRPEG